MMAGSVSSCCGEPRDSVVSASLCGGDEYEDKALLSVLFDSHCHFTDDSKYARLAKRQKLGGICTMSTSEEDWPKICHLVKETEGTSTKFVPAFGIHPWRALEKRKKGWLGELETLLIQHPKAIVGEIGLDKAAKPPHLLGSSTKIDAAIKADFWQKQIEMFTQQFMIAKKLQRPVSIHCVQAYGFLHDFFLKEAKLASAKERQRNNSSKELEELGEGAEYDFPPAVVLHSFGGTSEFINSLVKLPKIGSRFYFGFSNVINLQFYDTHDNEPKDEKSNQKQKLYLAIQTVPVERLLLETDWNDIGMISQEMISIAKGVFVVLTSSQPTSSTSKAKKPVWSIESIFDLAKQTHTNAQRALVL